MKFFIDTAVVADIEKAAEFGLVDGVTTNPTLIARAGQELEPTIKKICSIVDGPVHSEAISLDSEGMIREGRVMAKWAPNVVVKLPMTMEALKAVRVLSGEGINTNITLIFQPLQALLAAKAGATYISPFLGRLDDIATPGMSIVSQILAIYDNYGIETEIICASLRHPMHILECALQGAHIATIPPSVLAKLAGHPLTTSGIESFLADYNSQQKQGS